MGKLINPEFNKKSDHDNTKWQKECDKEWDKKGQEKLARDNIFNRVCEILKLDPNQKSAILKTHKSMQNLHDLANLKTAKKNNILPKTATVEALTTEIREKMYHKKLLINQGN